MAFEPGLAGLSLRARSAGLMGSQLFLERAAHGKAAARQMTARSGNDKKNRRLTPIGTLRTRIGARSAVMWFALSEPAHPNDRCSLSAVPCPLFLVRCSLDDLTATLSALG